MTEPSNIRSVADAVSLIRDGDTVAVGGSDGQRIPMSLAREIARQGRRRLHLVARGPSLALDLLVKAGCVATLEGPGVSTVGVRAVSHSPESLEARLRATADGVPFLPLSIENAAAVPVDADYRGIVEDPFGGSACVIVTALRPDIAIVHAEAADEAGRIRLGPAQVPAVTFDAVLARSAGRCLVSVEQIVTREAIDRGVGGLHFSADTTACISEAPYGAFPCGCEPLYRSDLDGLARDLEAADGWPATHDRYLDQVGARRLLAVSLNRALR